MGGITAHTVIDAIADTVKVSAPILGSVLGSPAAGIGLSLLASMFHVEPDKAAELLQAIQSDPDSILKLKQIENQHATALARIASSDYQTEVDDRKSAREREMAIRGYVPTFLAIGFLLNYAAIQFYCVTHDTAAHDIISARFQDVLIMIMSYYFGSSHREKPYQ